MAGLPTMCRVASGSQWARVTARRDHRLVDGLVRGHPPDAEPAGAPPAGGPWLHLAPGGAEQLAPERGRRGHHDAVGEPRPHQILPVVRRVSHGQRRTRRQEPQLGLRLQLAPGQGVVPRRHQFGRRDVVVVHHQRLRTGGQPRRHGRRGGELVDDDVAGLGLVRIRDRQLGLVRRLGIDHLDVDPRGDDRGRRTGRADDGYDARPRRRGAAWARTGAPRSWAGRLRTPHDNTRSRLVRPPTAVVITIVPKGKGPAHAARCYRSHCRLPGSAHRGAGPRSAAMWSRTRRSGQWRPLGGLMHVGEAPWVA